MKKYLFLIVLLLVNIILRLKPNTKNVINYTNEKKYGLIKYTFEFKNGINSKNISNVFNNYEDLIYIYKINDIDVNCSLFNDCINQIYQQESNEFKMNNIATGFKINNINLYAYDEKFHQFIKDNDILISNFY